MVSTTTNYNLTLYDSSDTTELFLDYRLDMCGTTNSNMTKIETALTGLQSSIDTLEAQKGAIGVGATFSAGTLYLATVSGITGYVTDTRIVLRLDTTNTGSVTLNINSLGVKSVYKIDNSGSVANLDAQDMGANREYYCRYNGTAWVVISSIGSPSVYRKATQALVATRALTDYDAPIQNLDPNGSDRDVNLPQAGVWNPAFIIYNSADVDGEDLLVKNYVGTLVSTVKRNQIGYFFSDGSTWRSWIKNSNDATGDRKAIIMQLTGYTQSCETGGLVDFVVPDVLDGKNLINIESNLVTSGTTGSMVVSIERYRGSWVEMCSSLLTFASGGTTGTYTINASNDDILAGDRIRIVIDSIHTTPAEGLSITLEFEKNA